MSCRMLFASLKQRPACSLVSFRPHAKLRLHFKTILRKLFPARSHRQRVECSLTVLLCCWTCQRWRVAQISLSASVVSPTRSGRIFWYYQSFGDIIHGRIAGAVTGTFRQPPLIAQWLPGVVVYPFRADHCTVVGCSFEQWHFTALAFI